MCSRRKAPVGAEDDDATRGEVTFAERPKIYHGILDPQLADDQERQSDDEEHKQRLHAPKDVSQPVPLLPLAEHDLPRRHRECQKAEADVVEIQRFFQQLRTLGLEIRGVLEQEVAGHKGQ